jgi:alpha-D-ribose 1-methylphosphonate 5-triphosphate synthase subunit PhnI
MLAIVDAGDEEVALRARQRRVERAAHAEIAVAHGEDALHLVLARRVEAFLLDLPGGDRLALLAQARVEIRDPELARDR